MGSVFGGHLALAGHDVTLVDVWREHMDAVAANGLDLRTPDGTSVIVPHAGDPRPVSARAGRARDRAHEDVRGRGCAALDRRAR